MKAQKSKAIRDWNLTPSRRVLMIQLDNVLRRSEKRQAQRKDPLTDKAFREARGALLERTFPQYFADRGEAGIR